MFSSFYALCSLRTWAEYNEFLATAYHKIWNSGAFLWLSYDIVFLITANTSVPFEEVYICPGEQTALICQTNNYSLLEWKITVPEHQRTEHRYVSVSLVAGYLTKLQINSTMFNFSRTSEYEAMPLVSTLFISYVGADLNQTLIYCSELGHLHEKWVSATKINVIGRGTFQYTVLGAGYNQGLG